MVSNEADPIRVASLDVVGFTIGLPRCQDGILGCGRNLPNCSFSRYAKAGLIVPPGPSPLVGRDRLLRSVLRTQRKITKSAPDLLGENSQHRCGELSVFLWGHH